MDRKRQKPRVTLRTTVWGSRNTSVHSVAMENSNYGCVGYSLTVSHAGDTLWPGIQTLLKEADFESANSLLVPKRLSRVHRNTINSCWRVCTEFWGAGESNQIVLKGSASLLCVQCPLVSLLCWEQDHPTTLNRFMQLFIYFLSLGGFFPCRVMGWLLEPVSAAWEASSTIFSPIEDMSRRCQRGSQRQGRSTCVSLRCVSMRHSASGIRVSLIQGQTIERWVSPQRFCSQQCQILLPYVVHTVQGNWTQKSNIS